MLNIRKLLLGSAVAAIMTFSTGDTQAANFGGVDVTPSVYEVSLKKIEFLNSGGGWVTFAEGGFDFDIASESAGQAVGTFAQGSVLPPGTYSAMRVTVDREFTLRAATADAGFGQPCHTETGNPANGTLNGGTITNVGVGAANGTPAGDQDVPVPVGADVTVALTSASIVEAGGPGGDLMMTVNQTFTIPADEAITPSMQIDFDVTNAAELLTTGVGTCAAFPQPPGIDIAVGG